MTVRTILRSAFESITNVERGFWYTMIHLFYQPGTVAREYLAGKHKTYYNPLRYLIVIVAVNTLIMVASGFYDRQYEAMERFQSGMWAQQEQEQQAALSEEEYTRTARIQEATKKFLNIIALLTLPFIGLVSYLGFRKRDFNYAEHLAFNAFWNAQSALFGLTIILLMFCIPMLIIWSFVFIMSVNILYYTVGYRQLFGITYGRAFLKATLTLIGGFLLFYLTTILLTFICVAIYLTLFNYT
jgi:hypothetical protein